LAFFFKKVLKEHEQEISSFEDLMAWVIFFSAFFINTLNFYTNTELVQYNLELSFWFLFVYFFSLVIMLPISILFVTGSNCLTYLKGSDKLNSLLAYIVFDIIAILAFFLRFFLQVIRWALFLTTYYLLHEFVFEWLYNTLISFSATQNLHQNFFL